MSYPTATAASTATPAAVHAAPPAYMGPQATVGPKLAYFRTLTGIFKMLQFILAVVVIICGAVFNTQIANNPVAGFISFVGSAHVFLTVVLFMLCICNVLYRIPRHQIVVLIYFGVMLLFILIAGIVAAVYGTTYNACAAAAFFLFADLVVTTVDSSFWLRYWRSGDLSPGSKVVIGRPPETASLPPPDNSYSGGGGPHY